MPIASLVWLTIQGFAATEKAQFYDLWKCNTSLQFLLVHRGLLSQGLLCPQPLHTFLPTVSEVNPEAVCLPQVLLTVHAQPALSGPVMGCAWWGSSQQPGFLGLPLSSQPYSYPNLQFQGEFFLKQSSSSLLNNCAQMCTPESTQEHSWNRVFY